MHCTTKGCDQPYLCKGKCRRCYMREYMKVYTRKQNPAYVRSAFNGKMKS